MKKLVWRTAMVSGGQVDMTLPEAFTSTGTFQNLGENSSSVNIVATGAHQHYEDIAVVALSAAIIAVCSWISIPTPWPVLWPKHSP